MKTFEEALAGMDDGQKAAIIRKVARAQTGDETVAEQVIRDVLSGDLRIVLVDGSVKFVDHTGRVIPLPGMDVVDANRSFYLEQPEINYAERLARVQEFYGKGAKFMSAVEFEDRCNAAIERISGDRQIANLIKGSHFPFVMPQLQGDLGQLLDNTMVPAMERSYKAQFPKRSFTNYRHDELTGQVTVIPGTRQERLVEAMVKGSVCGVYFPALQGFGITADREMIGRLPELLILSGMEVPAVVTAYPKITGRGRQTPGLDMASLQWQSSEYSLYFKANDDNANFDNRNLNANENYSGGVSVLGKFLHKQAPFDFGRGGAMVVSELTAILSTRQTFFRFLGRAFADLDIFFGQ